MVCKLHHKLTKKLKSLKKYDHFFFKENVSCNKGNFFFLSLSLSLSLSLICAEFRQKRAGLILFGGEMFF